ncbi:MAG: type II 3-dehydroquinate dehydratase [Oscillospiraceae bacterium]|jgi:3-dehydroquinate dehydratase-2|nr:type II 3-dehydroquinate dehydratase [Oscillospiraceae bacterium]
MKLRVINGPNLNMLGIREPAVYGHETYADLVAFVRESAAALGIEAECLQSNHEGEIVTWIQECFGHCDGIVINPAAYTHTSVAILDALKAVALPAIEVHLSDVQSREAFRHVSYAALACREVIAGHGFLGYRMAMEALTHMDCGRQD